MSILCGIFGHRMYFTGGVENPTYCKRWKCGHKGEGITWPKPPPMPKCKPPKLETS